MGRDIILASASEIRGALLKNAGVEITQMPARIDEESYQAAMIAEGVTPRDMADQLAELKARKLAGKHPEALIIGCDQTLDFDRGVLTKPQTSADAAGQLSAMRGKSHKLYSAAVIYDGGKPVWRHVGQVRLTMHPLSDSYIKDYVVRNWDSIRHSVGAYKLEEEGARLFSRIEGDYFTVLGLPLLDILSYLALQGILPR